MSRAVRKRAATIIHDFEAEKEAAEKEPTTTAAVDSASSPTTASKTGASPTSVGAGAGEGSATARCLVYCRVRPENKIDYEDGGTRLITVQNKTVSVMDEKDYHFDGTFGEQSQQGDVFSAVAVPCLQHAFKGFCSALMCYGQTGTGKSFTMCCTKPGVEGIIPRSATHIFDTVARDPARSYTITGQFVQIYRDNLGDLMTEGGKDKVDIRFDTAGGVSLPGCSAQELQSAAHFMTFYHEGDARRVVTATAMNPESSRGHTALAIVVSSLPVDDPCGACIRGKITFIDLAGYERFSKTGISNANPIMKDEAKTINASLLSLGHIVTALSNRDKHIPWRNSKLTRLLQDSIGGRSRTSIILTVGPSSDHLHETTNSLQFGMRAMAVKVEAKMSVSVDYMKLAAKLQALLSEKDEKINMLEVQVASRDLERTDLLGRQRRDMERLRVEHDQAAAELQAQGAPAEAMLRLGQQHEVELDIQQNQHQEELQYHEESESKEMLALISEQSRTEKLRESDVKLAQERLVSQFERKLADARLGTNSDLVKAVHDLGLRDAALVQRAAQIARLQAQVEILKQQVVALGEKPEVDDDDDGENEATFLDILQVEEIQNRLKSEVATERTMLLEARAQLDKVTQESVKRRADLQVQLDRVAFLTDKLAKEGVSVDDAAEQPTLEAKEKMVDPLVYENIKVELGSESDALRKKNDALESRVEELKQQVQQLQQQQQQATPENGSMASSAVSDSLSNTVRSTTGRRGTVTRSATMARLRKGSQKAQPSFDGDSLVQAQLEGARKYVEQFRKENALLKERVTTLEVCLAKNGTGLPPPPSSSAAAAAGGASALSPFGVLDEQGVLESLKHAEFEAAMELNAKLHDRLQQARRNQRSLEEYASKLSQTLAQVGLDAPSLPADGSAASHADYSASAGAFSMVDYMKLIRRVRDQCTTVQLALLMRSAVVRSQALELLNLKAGDASIDVPDLDEEVMALLQEKDAEMLLKDEMFLQNENAVQYLRRVVIHLEDQLLSHSVAPKVSLPQDMRDVIEAADAQNKQRDDEQRGEMQQRLESTQVEQARVNKMLESLSAERAKETSTFTNHKAELETELEQARGKARELEEQQRKQREELATVEDQKKKESEEYEEILRQNTREMMRMQAELCEHENLSVFDKLKMKWKQNKK